MEVVIKIDDNEAKMELYSDEGQPCSQYARVFDETSAMWDYEEVFNRLFIKQNEVYANDMLKHRGYLFLNEVYDMLGLPKTRVGQLVGWIYEEKNSIGDNRVDFMIYGNDEIIIDFNVDGLIIDRI
jgi:hypothetical protein